MQYIYIDVYRYKINRLIKNLNKSCCLQKLATNCKETVFENKNFQNIMIIILCVLTYFISQKKNKF